MSKAKRELRRRLAREQRMIEHRLADAVAPNLAGPVLGRANIGYELAERSRGVAHGGMGMVAKVVGEVSLAAKIDDAVHVLAMHRPYHESDHVLNIAYNALCGGTRQGKSTTRPPPPLVGRRRAARPAGPLEDPRLAGRRLSSARGDGTALPPVAWDHVPGVSALWG